MDRTGVVVSQKIAIGVSACCMGSPVRYNAKGWDMLAGMGRERNDFKWCPVCPECAAGLGVPVVRDARVTGALPGRALRGPGYQP